MFFNKGYWSRDCRTHHHSPDNDEVRKEQKRGFNMVPTRWRSRPTRFAFEPFKSIVGLGPRLVTKSCFVSI